MGPPLNLREIFIFPNYAYTSHLTKTRRDAQHPHLRWELCTGAHRPNMCQSGYGPSWGRAVAVRERKFEQTQWRGMTDIVQGETSVKILTSIREKDVFVVQSGSRRINDSIMELLIMISACKGGSANKITGT